MPQMAPMNWTLLFVSFILIFMVCMILIYFSTKTTLESSNYSTPFMSEINVLWKW